MRILFVGDVVGRSGRTVVTERLPGLIRDWKLDFVVVNAENAAAGFGITDKICAELYAAGVDVITTGSARAAPASAQRRSNGMGLISLLSGE